MAFLATNGSDLNELIRPSQEATLRKEFLGGNENLSDNWYDSVVSNNSTCCYFDDVNVQPTFFENSLTLLHFNIRSLHKNFDAMYNFLQSLDFLPDIICLSETRITDEPLDDILITSYSFIQVNSHSTVGGVAVYISKKVKFELSKNQLSLYNSKSLWLTIYTKNRL